MEIILWFKVAMDEIKTKKFCFIYFYRFVTSVFTPRPRNMDIYVFQAVFGFCDFLATSCAFWKLGVSSCSFVLNSE